MGPITRRSALALGATALGALSPPFLTRLQGETVSQAGALKFEIYKDSGGGFRWRLKSANGRVMATSGEGYKAKADCRNAIDVIKRGAGGATVTDLT